MEIFDWIFIVLFSIAIFCVFVLILILFALFKTKKKMNSIKKTRGKNKKKRIKRYHQLRKKKKQRIVQLIIVIFVGMFCFSSAFYSRYYQATNLTERDSNAIIQGHFLIQSIEEQFKQLSEDDGIKIQKNIYELSAKLSSYGTRTADVRLSKEGQSLLNRLYVNMKELGLNLSSQSVSNLKNQEISLSYQKDIEKMKNNQKLVFDFFGINESNLKKQ